MINHEQLFQQGGPTMTSVLAVDDDRSVLHVIRGESSKGRRSRCSRPTRRRRRWT